MEHKIFPSSNGFEFLEQYLTEIYGERGSFKHNLIRYINSDMFCRGCRFADSIEDIPEITFKEIQQLIEREKYFRNISVELQRKYDQYNKSGKITEEDYREIAGIMGLAPGHTDRLETLFPNTLDLYVCSEKEGKAIWDSVSSKPNIIAVMVNAMMDYIRSNQIINYNGRDMLSQGYTRNFFRGENAYYKTSKSSMFRGLDTMDENQAEETIFIRTIKMIDFAIWLSHLECVKKWPHGDVFHGAVAQHYGIATNGMDISSNLKIALFFACCYYDNKSKKWLPLSNDDFTQANSREKVDELGGDSRYGILYSAPADIAELSKVANIEDLHITNVTPVGIQPFQRCERQSAFIIETGRTYDLFKDRSFTKVKFRLTEEICDWIYHEMNKGELVYPNEGKGNCQDIAGIIMNSRQHTIEAFNAATHRLQFDENKSNEIKKQLEKQGYNFCGNIQWCSVERERELNRDCFESIKNINSTIRWMFCI
ncbi:MAG: FRG domain-containing protein [Ruminococcus sp.]|nr:FRG domain-containing protein [Ruminococcus sp.]